MNTIPTIDQVKALDGRIFATLTHEETSVLDFYLMQGRKYDVAISMLNKADPIELARAGSPAEADAIMKRANSLVSVSVGPGAAAAWAERDVGRHPPSLNGRDEGAGMERLNQALVLLGYKTGQAAHVRSNLLHAILLFAAAQKDVELEQACESEIKSISSAAGVLKVPLYYVMLGEKSADEAQSLDEARAKAQAIYDSELIPTTCWISDSEGNHVEDVAKSDGHGLAKQVEHFNKRFDRVRN